MSSPLAGLLPRTPVGRCRAAIGAVVAVVTALKLLVAANTYGTNDVGYWREFAAGVRRYGPIDLYGEKISEAPYNHPPLSGWLLVLLNWLSDRGFDFVFMIRVPAILADVVMVFLIFELIRSMRSLRESTAAAILVAGSPVLFIVSGFHGNTDPVFCMFVMLSVYLLTIRNAPGWAGLSFAVALSIKLVPIVVAPVLLLYVWRLGRRALVAFLASSGAFVLVLWGPVVLRRWKPFEANVLQYKGVALREFGPVQFATWAELPQGLIDFMIEPGRMVVVVVSALVPVLLLWRRPALLAPAAGLSLCLFLLLSPGFSMQYLVWPLAGAYLISFWPATAYNLIAGVFMVVVYDNWNRARPWEWDVARALPFRTKELLLAVIAWEALLVVTLFGLRLLRTRDPIGDTGGDSGGDADGERKMAADEPAAQLAAQPSRKLESSALSAPAPNPGPA